MREKEDISLTMVRNVQGLTIGSMWYDAGTNGSWAVSPHKPEAPLAHAFH